MAVELDGNLRMRGDIGPGAPVRVVLEAGRLRLVSGEEPVGDWDLSTVGMSVLQEGFALKVEGEEFILRTSDDVAFAEEVGVAAASPRLARRLAARHNPPEQAVPTADPPLITSNLSAVGFAVAGALILLGGTFLNRAEASASLVAGPTGFWLTFIIGGVLMIAVAYVMSIGSRSARLLAIILLVAMIGLFGWAVSGGQAGAAELTAYGFVAGGLVVGVAVLVGGGGQPG